MPMPKRRRSKWHTGSHRASAWRLTQTKQTNKCTNCGAPVLPHKVCAKCGFYKGKKVLVTRTEKQEARKAKQRAKDKGSK